MDLKQFEGGTSPFITLDACNGNRAEAVLNALESAANGDEALWNTLITNDEAFKMRLIEQGMSNPEKRSSISWDDATVLFIGCVELSKDGKPLPIGDGILREKVGRFPWGDGSLLNYMHEFIRPNDQRGSKNVDGYEKIVTLIENLSQRCGPSHVGHERYHNGQAGLNIRGFLSKEQVRELRLALSGRSWSVTADEPIDGGMRDVSRNLIAVLRAAERRDVGMFLRTHA
ncbi:hypothetical protein N9M86_01690 [Euryarchaeota archaeon]|nr:hypothetical protein [Euryarchaeota archaeon]MDA9166888.1 hypothetical protein [Candidatus Poseidoniaceae archaeon]MDA8610365.1 hypothetical protein [Euryarchaeota archaeon]MDA8689781.1 hypothetical protein [Euryarchaeota archaeon]MDA8700795.1 hypothetical protein [Euryarchaeota archaeon]